MTTQNKRVDAERILSHDCRENSFIGDYEIITCAKAIIREQQAIIDQQIDALEGALPYFANAITGKPYSGYTCVASIVKSTLEASKPWRNK